MRIAPYLTIITSCEVIRAGAHNSQNSYLAFVNVTKEVINMEEENKILRKLVAYLYTRTLNNCNRMVSTAKRIYNRILKHLKNYTKQLITSGSLNLVENPLDNPTSSPAIWC